MKAVVVNAPGYFEFCDVEMPLCSERGMLVKVLACGLCGGDLRTIRMGHHRVKLPFIVGHEVSGEVLELGKEYSGPWHTGERLAIAPVVYCGVCDFCLQGEFELCTGYKELAQSWQGGFAEYMAIPPEAVARGTIQRIPENIDPVHATIVEPLSSCVNAQEKGNVGLGDTVVVIGAGPIGTFHLELARARGAAKVIVADVNEGRLRLMEPYNPDHLINAEKVDLVAEVRRITSGKGSDVIITANPVPETQVQAIEMARKGGRVLLFGGLPKDKARPGIDMNLVHYNALHLIGTTIFAPRHNRIAMELVASGRVSAEKFISHIMPLSQFAEGVNLAMDGKARKVVFVP
jgi:L-iditol 2-dehydrogenase